MTTTCEYLVSHGKSGGFGRFAAGQPIDCRRGDRVVVRSSRGLEVGTVLCPATQRQQRVLEHTPVGEILRPATGEDEVLVAKWQSLSQQLFAEARRRVRELGLDLEILDAEVFLDGRQAILQCLASEEDNFEPFLEELKSRFSLTILLENLATPVPAIEEHGGCGKPGCGHAAGGGGCGDCGSGGGCSSCGGSKVDLREYFSHLREKMEQRNQRTPLL